MCIIEGCDVGLWTLWAWTVRSCMGLDLKEFLGCNSMKYW